MRFSVAACLGVASVLGACASPYTPPASGPTARVRIVSQVPAFNASASVNHYDSGRCEAAVDLGHFGGVLNPTDFRPIGMPGAETLKEGQFIERLVKTGARKMFSARMGQGSMFCYVSWSYIPEDGTDYEINVGWNAHQCFVRTDRLGRDEHNRLTAVPEPSARLEPTCTRGFN